MAFGREAGRPGEDAETAIFGVRPVSPGPKKRRQAGPLVGPAAMTHFWRMKYILLLAGFVLTAALVVAQKPAPGAAESGAFSGKVSETMDAAGYTYAQLNTGAKKVWIAAPQFKVKVGDTVAVASAMPMTKYHSKTLKRDFDVVYFTGDVVVNGKAGRAAAAAGELPKGHPPLGGEPAKPRVDVAGLKKADGGLTVGEIYAGKSKLKGQEIKVRGKVVKYNAGILGKNWLHIQDGTGDANGNDLTITTSATAKVGDTVLVAGKVGADRDFGGGYKYGLIVEDAKVTVE